MGAERDSAYDALRAARGVTEAESDLAWSVTIRGARSERWDAGGSE
jgi:hypothetical protein